MMIVLILSPVFPLSPEAFLHISLFSFGPVINHEPYKLGPVHVATSVFSSSLLTLCQCYDYNSRLAVRVTTLQKTLMNHVLLKLQNRGTSNKTILCYKNDYGAELGLEHRDLNSNDIAYKSHCCSNHFSHYQSSHIHIVMRKCKTNCHFKTDTCRYLP